MSNTPDPVTPIAERRVPLMPKGFLLNRGFCTYLLLACVLQMLVAGCLSIGLWLIVILPQFSAPLPLSYHLNNFVFVALHLFGGGILSVAEGMRGSMFSYYQMAAFNLCLLLAVGTIFALWSKYDGRVRISSMVVLAALVVANAVST